MTSRSGSPDDWRGTGSARSVRRGGDDPRALGIQRAVCHSDDEATEYHRGRLPGRRAAVDQQRLRMGSIALLSQDREGKSEGVANVRESAELTSPAFGDDEEQRSIRRSIVTLRVQLLHPVRRAPDRMEQLNAQ